MPGEHRTTVDLGAAALRYAEAGWCVLPLQWPTVGGRCSCGRCECTSQGKHPLVANGVRDATDDTDQVTWWWARWPRANIGVAMTNDVFVIDIDPHNGGEDTWTELVANGGQIWTKTSLSGRGDGGRHLWLRHPGRTLKGRLGPGVDVKRVPNAYVVAPPSIHFATLKPYTWLDESTPLAIPPTWLVDLLDPPRGPVAHVRNGVPACSFGRWNPGGILHTMATAVEGTRNNVLFWCARRIGEDVTAGKAPERQALEALEILAEIAETTGLPTSEVDRTIRAGYLA